MPISFPAIPLPFLPPLYYADIVPGASPIQMQLKLLLIGFKNSSGATGANNTPYILSGSEATRLFGAGSMLAAMYAKARAQAPYAEIWGMSLGTGEGAIAAQGSIKVPATPAGSGEVLIRIAGYAVRIAVRPDSAAFQAQRIRNAINAATGLPVTAALDPGDETKVIVTAKFPCSLGAWAWIEKNLPNVPQPLTASWQVVGMGGVTTGSGSPLVAEGLAALSNQRFDVIAASIGVVSRESIVPFMDGIGGRWSPAQQLYGHWFVALPGTLAGLVTYGQGTNDPHCTTLGLPGAAQSPPWEYAAAIGAHATLHWSEPPELSRPLQTLKLRNIVAPPRSKAFTTGEQNSLLFAGISTFNVNDADEATIGRLVTNRRVNDWGDEDPSWRDAVTMFQTMYFARRMRQAITSTFPRAALTTRDSGIPGFASPGAIRDLYIHEYKLMEAQGLVENSEAFAEALIVERNANDANRIDSLIKPDLVNQLRVVANLIETHLELDAVA